MKTIVIVSLIIVVFGGGYALFQNGAEIDHNNTDSVLKESDDVANIEENTATETEVSSEENEVDDVNETETQNVREFTMDSFLFGYSMEEIKVTQGDTVTINLTSSEGLHDWVVDEFEAATEKISAGGNTSVTFVADKAGTFEFYCSVGSHRAQGMVGKLIVE